ncbi:hypothetical protein QJU89_07335 [Pasteurella skyensis]|uniref:Toxin n=1 Tax=Phocoenobacter skyensis TaxID=97481 RepID=A0AAJ6P0Q6_9PAST|nr:hypothetical protein [Pasteurella skyensis]MDP8162569.1 hypothetical protein [Pasteurella skyensis]MDP8172833.1 hypothetical protein [Pasteurella skyensis]MDP8177323.1 hypothetical protein [Pasteurella skyensis]MDP8179250.1 hypothetical protein [Pasteurella skyensis]MDP8183503.1 hypothetical protein [Pasteurella skyensis]
MKKFKWNEDKNKEIQRRHNLRFEDLQGLEPIIIIEKHNPEKYPSQDAFIYVINDYPVFVPFVEEEDYIFLKNMIPKRAYKKLIKEIQDGKTK